MTFPIISVFQLKTQGTELLCPFDPHSLHHPFRLGFPFTTYHQENRPVSLKEGLIRVVPLQKKQIVQINTSSTPSLRMIYLTPCSSVNNIKMIQLLFKPLIRWYSNENTIIINIPPLPFPKMSPRRRVTRQRKYDSKLDKQTGNHIRPPYKLQQYAQI